MNAGAIKGRHREWLKLAERGDYERVAERVSAGHVLHQSWIEPIAPGPQALVHALRRLELSFRPWLVTIVAQAANDDQVMTRFDAFGRHVGRIGPLWPSGRWLRFSAMLWTRFAGDMAVESWIEADVFGALSELGAVRPQAGIVLTGNDPPDVDVPEGKD